MYYGSAYIVVVIIVMIVRLAYWLNQGGINEQPMYVMNRFEPRPEFITIQSRDLDALVGLFDSLPAGPQERFRQQLTQEQRYGLGVIIGAYRKGSIEVRHLSKDAYSALRQLHQWSIIRSLEAHLALFNSLSEEEQIEILNKLDNWIKDFSSLNNKFLDYGSLDEDQGKFWSEPEFCRTFHEAMQQYYFSLDAKDPDAENKGMPSKDYLPFLGEEVSIPMASNSKFRIIISP